MSDSRFSPGSSSRPRYDWSKDYRWNYERAPTREDRSAARSIAAPVVPGKWDFLGIPTASPLGIAAGPLLNGAWCLYYAELGFDVLTYKTVRSARRECYPLPNLQPVECAELTGAESRVAPRQVMQGSWAVSFGMPSSDPVEWRRDIEQTRHALAKEKVLSVSVVGTIQDGWDLQRLAEDYATCARWAVESGADCIEANFSCPNVSTCDGQLYQDADQARLVACVIREAIGNTPFVVKIGHFPEASAIEPLVQSLAGIIDAFSMTNSIAAKVGANDAEFMFDGQPRGICGDAIRESSIRQIRRFADVIARHRYDTKLIGVGGVHCGQHVRDYLNAGAHACHLATAVMINPEVGLEVRQQLLG